MSANAGTIRAPRSVVPGAWIAIAIAAAITGAVVIGSVTSKTTPAPARQAAATQVTTTSGEGIPPYRTELVKGGLQPAPFSAILTPKMVPAFKAEFGGKTETATTNHGGVTLVMGGERPIPFGQ